MMTHNTSISRIVHWDWRVPPADRKNSEVKTYYLSPEELGKYRKGGPKKMEDQGLHEISTEGKISLKEVLRWDFATGEKTIEQIAAELNIKPALVKAAAVRMGLIEKKQKPSKKPKAKEAKPDIDINLTAIGFHGLMNYEYRDGNIGIWHSKDETANGIVFEFSDINRFIEELQTVRDKIKEVNRQ